MADIRPRPSASDRSAGENVLQEVEEEGDVFSEVRDAIGSIVSMGGDPAAPQQDIEFERVAETVEQAVRAAR